MQKQESTSETYLRCEMRRDPGIIKRHPLFIAFQFLYALARFNLAVKIWTMKHRCKTLSLVILNPCSDMLELGGSMTCGSHAHAETGNMHRGFIIIMPSRCAMQPASVFCTTMWCSRVFANKKRLGKGDRERKKNGKNAENTSFDRIFALCRL